MSPAQRLARLPPEVRAKVLAQLSDREADEFPYDWEGWWARPNQLPPPGDWTFWLLLAGRGFGKTRTGAECVRSWVRRGARRIALIAPTQADIRQVMIEGPAGILATSPPWDRPAYEVTRRHRLTWPNGAVAHGFSAEEPDRLRGPAHDKVWCDELAAWGRLLETWDMMMFGLRDGEDPQVVVTTTPRPLSILTGTGQDGQRLGLLRDPRCVVTRGSTYENRSNLAPTFIDTVVKPFEGTRLGRQELEAEVLEDVPGALWTRGVIEATRCSQAPADLVRVVVAIDPSVTTGDDADEAGVVVCGRDSRGHGYVLADCSGRYAPNEWARVALAAYVGHGADVIVAEVNNGGAMVEGTIRNSPGGRNVPYREVVATRGKARRAQPVSMLWEAGRAHVVGTMPRLEDQMCELTPDFDRARAGYSPDRCDAMVWAMTDLFVDSSPAPLWNEGMMAVVG